MKVKIKCQIPLSETLISTFKLFSVVNVKGKQGLFIIIFHLKNPLPFTARKEKEKGDS
jgi:hypothetical protein